ncbi:MAG: lipid A biosynthesis lauroyl acyltransferase [Bacteroidetes bacterium]|nr:MAG: lipid A biosynthesis lauroyl acyltransferase [Bacteroidota bacterium]
MKPLRKRIKYTVIYWFILALIHTTNLFPRIWVLKTTGWLGRVAFWMIKEARLTTIENLTSVFGEKMTPQEIKALAQQVFEMIGKNAGDIIRGFPIKQLEKLERFVKVEGEENLIAAHAKGNGVVLISGHIGAFEFMGTYLGLKGYRPLGIGTILKDERLNQLLVANRTSRGSISIERGKETFKILKTLKTGGVVALFIDQDTKVKSRFINFLGKPAATPIGGTIMAQKTGAAVVPIYITMQPDFSQLISIYPEVKMQCTGNTEQDLVHNTQLISDSIEHVIRECPSQWIWMHERWKTQPGEEIR